MANRMGRRKFFGRSLLLSTGVAGMGFRFEERHLLAQAGAAETLKASSPAPTTALPRGRIGNLEISRLICGGNLISGFGHSRDLIYVSDLLNRYHTDEKVCETLQISEENGINTAILRLDDHCTGILKKYWNEVGGKIQWIAQVKAPEGDLTAEARQALDLGASAVFLHGGVADSLVQAERTADIAAFVQYVKAQGVPAGVAGHMIEVPMACEAGGVDPDFYMKTLNAKNYWSAGPVPRLDSVWEETPEQTIAFMQGVKKPWIAYKVLGAGAIAPAEGFKYAFHNGADFLCVGMFDFQVAENARIASGLLKATGERARPWQA